MIILISSILFSLFGAFAGMVIDSAIGMPLFTIVLALVGFFAIPIIQINKIYEVIVEKKTIEKKDSSK